jgi:hypothetical protein
LANAARAFQKRFAESLKPELGKSVAMNYSTGKKETLAIVTALDKYWPYIKGSEVTVWTDHKPLVNYLSRKGNGVIGREACWWEKMNRNEKINSLVNFSTTGEALKEDQAAEALDSKQRAFVENMSLIDGYLYHLWSPLPGAQRTKTVTQIVVPLNWRLRLLKSHHNQAGHYGPNATYDLLRMNYW